MTFFIVMAVYLLGVAINWYVLKREFHQRNSGWFALEEDDDVYQDESKFAWVWPLVYTIAAMVYLFEILPRRWQDSRDKKKESQ